MIGKLICARCGSGAIHLSCETTFNGVAGVTGEILWQCEACGEQCSDPVHAAQAMPVLDVTMGFTVLTALLALMFLML